MTTFAEVSRIAAEAVEHTADVRSLHVTTADGGVAYNASLYLTSRLAYDRFVTHHDVPESCTAEHEYSDGRRCLTAWIERDGDVHLDVAYWIEAGDPR